jgi:hypothetical protein
MQIVNDRQEFLNALDLKDKYCVEIGVFRGDFSKMILEKNPLYLHLVDPFEHNQETYGPGGLTTAYSDGDDLRIVKARFKDDKRVVVLKYFSYEVVNWYSDNHFDFIYHDASHLYKDLKKDLNQWLPKLKEGGIMAGHDYTENYKDYVGKAVDEFCKEHNFEMFLFNQQGGDFALRRK